MFVSIITVTQSLCDIGHGIYSLQPELSNAYYSVMMGDGNDMVTNYKMLQNVIKCVRTIQPAGETIKGNH